jgi:hypothetical protein
MKWGNQRLRQQRRLGCDRGKAAMKVSVILDFIDHGQIALPEFQRGYV